MIRRWCEREGVTVHVAARVTAIRRADGREALVATLDSGKEIDADTLIVAAGVRPNVDFLRGSGIDCENGIRVDATMQTNVAGVYAAGDVAAAIDFATGERGMNAIQPNAVEQARVAALNMAGKRVESHGSMALNVLDTLGLVSSSFGQWAGVAGRAVRRSSSTTARSGISACSSAKTC